MSSPSPEELELQFCEEYFWSRGLELYPEQEQAIGKIFRGDSLLVSVPTGTGKTMLAKAAIFSALATGRRVVYTTPLRALTEEKYRELCDVFGADNVGLATGDVQRNRHAPIQVEVAEVLWNRIFTPPGVTGAVDVVVMDEAHYFNDHSRGYVWEQSIIGLPAAVQLILLSATIGQPESFCQWTRLARGKPLELVYSTRRQVPLHYEYREEYLIDIVKEVAHAEDVPALIFVFGRTACFETARLLKSCRRFVSDDERQVIEQQAVTVLQDRGAGNILWPLLRHGIGIHHAGILPPYRRLVESLTSERLLKVVVCTETISAGINLPAKTVIFSSLRKYINGQARLVTPAEFHQMAGRAGRPQFDKEGRAIALAPEQYVQELRKELKALRNSHYDESKAKKRIADQVDAAARANDNILWKQDDFDKLRQGQPAALTSHSSLEPDQILTLRSSGEHSVDHIIDNLLTTGPRRQELQRRVGQIEDNLTALQFADPDCHEAHIIRELRGLDGMFIAWLVKGQTLDEEQAREACEFVVSHSAVTRILNNKLRAQKRLWIKNRLREMRADNPHANWDDAEAEYDLTQKPPPAWIEIKFQEFRNIVPHPELHGGKSHKTVLNDLLEDDQDFLAYIEKQQLAREEGTFFTYLMRLWRAARKIHELSHSLPFALVAEEIHQILAQIDYQLK